MASDCILIPFGLTLGVYLSNDCVGDSRAPRRPTGIPAFQGTSQNWPRVAPALGRTNTSVSFLDFRCEARGMASFLILIPSLDSWRLTQH